MTAYDKGDSAVLTVTFRNAAGVLTDPATVKFRAVDPAGAITNWTYGVDGQVARSSQGVYVATLPLPTVGVWAYHWDTEAGTAESATLEVSELATARTAAENTARSQLARMVSFDTEPTLSEADLDLLLSLARIPDTDDIGAGEAGWTATYDLNAAAAEGWRWKAGKAAASYAFTMDGESAERSFLHIRCNHMAEMYRKKIIGSVPISSENGHRA